jgi:hypothetical protein
MSGSGWSKFIKIGGLTALFLFVIWATYSDLSSVSDSYEHSAADASTHYAENAEKLIGYACRPLTAAEKQKCIDQAEQFARENQRIEQDLAAQKVTAWWTKIMGIAALIGMGLSAVGVWLVKTTFDETRKSNAIAQRALLIENRPWLVVKSINTASVDVVSTRTADNVEIGICVRFEYVFENIGKIPASHFFFELVTKPSGQDGFEQIYDWDSYRNPLPVDCLAPNEARIGTVTLAQPVSDLFLEGNFFYVGIRTLYRHAESEILHETRQIWEVYQTFGNTGQKIQWHRDDLVPGTIRGAECRLKKTLRMT